MKDDFTFSCTCQDGSFVHYRIVDGIKIVYHHMPDGTKRKAEYESGTWINL